MFHPLSKKEMEEAADKYIEMLQIKTASRETPIKSLSGGNQQKVIIGRWLLTNPDYLILDEPTRGIAVSYTHLDVYKRQTQNKSISTIEIEKAKWSVTVVTDKIVKERVY